jgi:membrane protease YdiL (CAAX protease family)
MVHRPRVWVVFSVYGFAFLAILIASILAVAALGAMDPDARQTDVVTGFPGLIAGGIASSAALTFTVLVAARGMPPARLRLVPGRESGRHLIAMLVGVLSLGQALDSLAVIVGVADRGSMLAIRRALTGVSGPDLFFAVIVIGLMAGAAEEIFFRGYMQSLLRERWRPVTVIVVTSACFGLLHLDWIHAPLAFVLGLYLGLLTELSGSALPAVACHVVNNGVFTVVTALIGSVPGIGPNVALLASCGLLSIACVWWLSRAMPGAPTSPASPAGSAS